MQGEGCSTRSHEADRDVEARARAILEPAAHLDRHRNRDGLGHRLDDPAGPIRVVQQGCARTRLRHLANRAPEVDVDEVRAGRLDHARRLAHHLGLGAEDLNRQRMLGGGDPQVPECPLVAVLETGARDHLRADETGAEAAALTAERLDADARHGRQDEPGRNLDVPDPPGFSKIHLHRAGNGTRRPVDVGVGHRYHCRPRRRLQRRVFS